MALSYRQATRYAQIVVLLASLAGVAALFYEARGPQKAPTESGEVITTTKSVTEKKATAKGPESTERSETSTTPNSHLVERLLGRAGLWFVRGILILVAAFLTGALVQRILLGKFAFKAGSIEIPELQAPALHQFSPELISQFNSGASFSVALTDPQLRDPMAEDAISQIIRAAPAKFAVIDLGTGRNWLTTRLFLLALIVRRMRSVRTFVFVETCGGVEKKYLGIQDPDIVRWMLARQYGWLEKAFARSYAGLDKLEVVSDSGGLEESVFKELLNRFIRDPQIHRNSTPYDQEESKHFDSGWEHLGSGWEHASWITGWLASNLFNLKPTTTSFVHLGDTKGAQHAFAALDSEGPFVAVLNPKGVYLELIDREEVLESLAAETRVKLAAAIVTGDADSAEGLSLDSKIARKEDSGFLP
jgi:hypothetical protein